MLHDELRCSAARLTIWLTLHIGRVPKVYSDQLRSEYFYCLVRSIEARLTPLIRRRSAGQQRTGVQEGPTCRCKRAAPPHRPTRPNRHDRWQPCAGSIELVAPAAASVDVPPASRGAVVPFPATKTSANAPLIAANRANLVMRPFSSCLSLLSQWRQSAMDRAINLEFLWTLPPSSELHPKWSSRIRPPLTERSSES